MLSANVTLKNFQTLINGNRVMDFSLKPSFTSIQHVQECWSYNVEG